MKLKENVYQHDSLSSYMSNLDSEIPEFEDSRFLTILTTCNGILRSKLI